MKKVLSVILSLIFLLGSVFNVCTTAAASGVDDVVIDFDIALGKPLSTVYISSSGSDSNWGTIDSPVFSLSTALDKVADNGTIIISDTCTLTSDFSWPDHNISVTITGGTLDASAKSSISVGDNVTFDNITLTFYSEGSWYLNGNEFKINENVTVTNTSAESINLYGGSYKETVEGDTNVTVLSGNFKRIYGGGNGGTVNGNTNVYVGGTVNKDMDETDHSGGIYVIGGGSNEVITGSTNLTFTGSAKSTYIYAGSFGANSTIGNGSNLTLSGGKAVGFYGGSRGADVGSGTNVVMTGGTFEQGFGANNGAGFTGDVVMKILGGTITRRIYGGCYNDGAFEFLVFNWTWSSSDYVIGDVTLILGGNANISFTSSESDRSIYAHSRHSTLSSSENTRLIFDDDTAYTKYKDKLMAQDSTMQGIMDSVDSAADIIHYYTYTANGNELIQTCSYCGTTHSATATLTKDSTVPTVYSGEEIKPFSVVYGGDWYGDALSIVYSDNVNAGTASSSIAQNGVTATAFFTIDKAENTAVPQITATDETVSGKADGKIAGLTTEMEISINGGAYTPVTDVNTLFQAGTYDVRYSEKDNYKPSCATTVTINSGRMLIVTFKAEGSEDIVIEVEYNGTITDVPEVPHKDNYDKVEPYWSVSDFSNIVTDMTVNAVYTLNTYTVTLDYGTENGQVTYTVKAGDTVTIPDTGFAMDKNWYTSLTGDEVYSSQFLPYEDTTLYCIGSFVNSDNSDVKNRYSQNYKAVTDNGENVLYYDSPANTVNGYGENYLRLSQVEDNTTYKITVKYKANGGNIGFAYMTADKNNVNLYDTGMHGGASNSVYVINQSSDGEYVTAVMFVTTDLIGTMTANSLDDIKTVKGDYLYFCLKDNDTTGESDIYIKDINVENVGQAVGVIGARLLTEEAERVSGNQAIRYCFDYVTDDGNNIYISGESYKVVERGFVFRNGGFDSYLNADGSMKEGNGGMTIGGTEEVIYLSKTDNFEECWEYNSETKEMCFSTYIKGFETNDENKLMVRGYVTFLCDDQEITVYSATVNRSVAGIRKVLEAK